MTRAGDTIRLRQICMVAIVLFGVTEGKHEYMSNMSKHLKQIPTLASRKFTVAQRADSNLTYRLPKIFEVGGPGAIWAAPSTGDFFEKWASSITFRRGDVLQFNKPISGYVDEVPAASFYNCSTKDYYRYWSTTDLDKLVIQIIGLGFGFFIQDAVEDCGSGMKFSVEVGNVAVPPPPQAPPKIASQERPKKEFEVGGSMKNWTIPSTTSFYIDWAQNTTFRVGDTLRYHNNRNDTETANDYAPGRANWDGDGERYPQSWSPPSRSHENEGGDGGE